MVDWQITATTIYCDAVRDEVTIFVYRDGSLGCTGFGQNPGKENKSPQNIEAEYKHPIKPGCLGLPCDYTTGYRAKLMSEENNQNG
ncbi:MAG: hypothetical protein WCS74_01465 [Dehalococcoidales bacterium]|jgi:hypothetical protein|nr:hypothetical protein [Dehalococcoidales bacterium]MDD3264379.1 hypothetical protein [Dehalococcoidales bacterium]MDD4322166.1 hypothetical protein [Dehalococcoidales bacterium]MDD4793737.1 hypothetical protein [Dehalococcoidales bacterium]MDD5121802.1 hypothetical protein [Dehalococcoidales bacterium]